MSKKMTLERLAIITMKAFEAVDRRFDSMNIRFSGIDSRLDGIDSRLDGIDGHLKVIDSRLDGIDRRLDHHSDYYVNYFAHNKLVKRVEKLEKTHK